MKRLYILTMICALAAPASAGNAYARQVYEPALQNLHIVLSKLKSATRSVRDLDEMRNLGMPDSEVERLKAALEMKIRQLTQESLDEIRKL